MTTNKAFKSTKKELIDHEPLTTKIYYYVDDQTMPYTTEVPVPPSKITLADFKQFINRRNYKFYYKVMDSELNKEVKTDILNENAVLLPNEDGRFELFLLTDNVLNPLACSSTASVLPTNGIVQNYRQSVHGASEIKTYQKKNYYPQNYRHSKYDNKRYFEESSSQDDSNLFFDSNLRNVSDEDSQSSNFTSISQQLNKKSRMRKQRRRPAKSFSFLSTTFDDSMALNLITVSFHLDRRHRFGMSVITRTTSTFCGVFVHGIEQGGIVALDGRIKVGYLILYVDGISLDQFENDEKVEFLRKKVHTATACEGYLELTCAKSETTDQLKTIFRLPPEPVRPIDPYAWAVHYNAMLGLNNISEETDYGNTLPFKNGNIAQNGLYNSNNLPVESNEKTTNFEVRGPSSGVGTSVASSLTNYNIEKKPFNLKTDKLTLIYAMANSITAIRSQENNKVDISFLGSDLLLWLEKNVAGMESEQMRINFATMLLNEDLILKAVNTKEFTQKCFYTFNDEIKNKLFKNNENLNTIKRGALTLIQNPAIEISSSDDATFGINTVMQKDATFKNKLSEKKKFKQKKSKGLSRIFQKMFCLPFNVRHNRKIFKTHLSPNLMNEQDQKVKYNNAKKKKNKKSIKKIIEKKDNQNFIYQSHMNQATINTVKSTHIP